MHYVRGLGLFKKIAMKLEVVLYEINATERSMNEVLRSSGRVAMGYRDSERSAVRPDHLTTWSFTNLRIDTGRKKLQPFKLSLCMIKGIVGSLSCKVIKLQEYWFYTCTVGYE